MGKTLSPLRYPGGKSKIYHSIKNLIISNGFSNRVYVEPFAGGFGVGLELLINGIIHDAILNDYDRHIYDFWYSVFYKTNDLVDLIKRTEITLDEREKQREIYKDIESTRIQDGFATLFLNRVNYSGVLFGGPIGGNKQNSKYKLDCRFNKDDIIERIKRAAQFKEHIVLYQLDAVELLTKVLDNKKDRYFYNCDPPYVIKGKSLYETYFCENDHIQFSKAINQLSEQAPFIITYDNCQLIRDIYKDYYILEYDMYHSAHSRIEGKELVITNIDGDQFVWDNTRKS